MEPIQQIPLTYTIYTYSYGKKNFIYALLRNTQNTEKTSSNIEYTPSTLNTVYFPIQSRIYTFQYRVLLFLYNNLLFQCFSHVKLLADFSVFSMETL